MSVGLSQVARSASRYCNSLAALIRGAPLCNIDARRNVPVRAQ